MSHRSTVTERQIIADILTTTLDDLSRDTALEFLQQARAWHSHAVFDLLDHLRAHPDALTSGDSDCPLSLIRLTHILTKAGYTNAVIPKCARCGADCGTLSVTLDGGRVCMKCRRAATRTSCVRCGRSTRPDHRRTDGIICRSCRDAEPASRGTCDQCGLAKPLRGGPNGTRLCDNCIPRPKRTCAGCRRHITICANTDAGPLCVNCYRWKHRSGPCQICGNHRQLIKIDADGNGTCTPCATNRQGTCASCGRVAFGHNIDRGRGEFRCRTCLPKRSETCAICGNDGQPNAFWPLGPVCIPCYGHAKHHPQPCVSCGNTRVLVARNDNGDRICGPCCGADVTFICQRCGDGRPFHNHICEHCTADDLITATLGRHGTTHPQLEPLARALRGAAHPISVIAWLKRTTVAKALSTLASTDTAITHELLDTLDQDHTLHQLRYRLVITGVLPKRVEHLDRAETWMKQYIPTLPTHHRKYLHPFARWYLINRARRRASNGPFTPTSGYYLRAHIRNVATFLSWLDEHHLTLSTLKQADIDTWLTTGPTDPRYRISAFLTWAQQHHHTPPDNTIPKRLPGQSRLNPLSSDEAWQHLDRCLTDENLPLTARVAGALTLLYGLTRQQLVTITADNITSRTDDIYLTIAQAPIIMPPALADLIIQLAQSPPDRSVVSRAVGGTTHLFPGANGQPMRAAGMHRLLKRHNIPASRARDTALLALAADLPAPVLADLLGLSTQTLETWATHATRDWNHYIQARIEANTA